jgi:hypothetical protein
MHPLRLLFFIVFGVFGFIILLGIGQSDAPEDEPDNEPHNNLGPSFDWRAPSSSLFPPSAMISLTDDNSTFFLARPAAFGPSLPAKSLNGQLWIGSGFGDDKRLGRGGGGFSTGAEGELGCSDVPGWYDGEYLPRISGGSGKRAGVDTRETNSNPGIAGLGVAGKDRKENAGDKNAEANDSTESPAERDGTDDHLHHPLPASGGIKTNGESLRGSSARQAHADIQSMQESAEIAGKIVLLSRGGCGFLEKVKWVQRRGGVALIVGDDVRGGQLVTMYARGDTSNVTIPALFTSHTTAHLLSSLIPAEKALVPDRKETVGSDKSDKYETADDESVIASAEDMTELELPQSWFRTLFGLSTKKSLSNGRRPPSSGSREWIYPVGTGRDGSDSSDERSPVNSDKASPASPAKKIDDGFVIGVHDWRDPDMVAQQSEDRQSSSKNAVTTSNSRVAQKDAPLPAPGRIVPGSGIYQSLALPHVHTSDETIASALEHGGTGKPYGSRLGWLFRHFFSDDLPDEDDVDEKDSSQIQASGSTTRPTQHDIYATPETSTQQDDDSQPLPPHREGLWITLSPTSMSSSPFFDTLLVLVVSPLVTLTVVYALLLLRARIRRRRWRAPKSVVEQLPVRTYHTIPPSTTATSPAASVVLLPQSELDDDTAVNAETPLLRSSTSSLRSFNSTSSLNNDHHHQRSRTAPEGQQSSERDAGEGERPTSPLLRQTASASIPTATRPSDERPVLASSNNTTSSAAALAEWRRRYGGKQRECVVCLEEYIDGVSRVMSLPCGHEFHAECMYVNILLSLLSASDCSITNLSFPQHSLAHHPPPHLSHLQRRRCPLPRLFILAIIILLRRPSASTEETILATYLFLSSKRTTLLNAPPRQLRTRPGRRDRARRACRVRTPGAQSPRRGSQSRDLCTPVYTDRALEIHNRSSISDPQP